MKILVVAISFAITIGGLFLFENYKTRPKEENYAQIIRELNDNEHSKTATPKPAKKSATKISRSASAVPSFATAPSPISSPTTTPSPMPTQQPSTPSPISPSASTPISSPSSTPQQNNQITVISLTSPVKQNSTAQLSISTQPNAQCSIKVTLPSGSQSTAKGLETKPADSTGSIVWSWGINWNTTPGSANIDITCSKDEQSFSKSLQMIIIKR